MPFMPFSILGIWLRGLLAIALLGLSIYLLREWYERTTTVHEPNIAADADADGMPRLHATSRPDVPARLA